MSGELKVRIASADCTKRMSVYLRSDGKYEYVEEMLSEWDDAPPSWVAMRQSGIFSSAAEGVAEAKRSTEWIRNPSKAGDRPPDVDPSPRNWRPISVAEHALIIYLLRREFTGQAEILEQMKSVEVMRIRPGFSLKLHSDGPLADVKDSDAPSMRPTDYIPVEAFYDDVVDETNGLIRVAAPVRLALHVTCGRLSELEIYKENGKPILIDPYEIDLARVHFY